MATKLEKKITKFLLTRVIKLSRILIEKINLIAKYVIYNSIYYINEIVKIVFINSFFIILLNLIIYYFLFISDLEDYKDFLNFYYLNNFIVDYLLINKTLKYF